MKQSLGNLGILFPNPVMVVGTYDVNGNPNVTTVAWGGIASSAPNAVSIAVRPSRYTFEVMSRCYRSPRAISGQGFSIGKKFISK